MFGGRYLRQRTALGSESTALQTETTLGLPASKQISKFQLPEKYAWEGLRIKKYEANKIDEFQNHVDVLDHDAARRFLTFFCYLDNNSGGATDFPVYGWRGKLHKKMLFHSPSKKGSVILFPPMWPWLHRGNRPKRKPKYIVQTYLHYV